MGKAAKRSFIFVVVLSVVGSGLAVWFFLFAGWSGPGPERFLVVPRASGPMIMDGMLSEPEWQAAFDLAGEMVTPVEGEALLEGERVFVGLLRDDENLYIAWRVQDQDVRSPYTRRDSTLWTAPSGKSRMDVVELFLRPSEDQDSPYLELQISPSSAVFDALFTSHRLPHWKEARSTLDMKVRFGVIVDGTLNGLEPDQGYVVEAAIPFKEIPGISGAPEAGTRWQANLYRLSNGPERPAGWWSAGPDFHSLAGNGWIEF